MERIETREEWEQKVVEDIAAYNLDWKDLFTRSDLQRLRPMYMEESTFRVEDLLKAIEENRRFGPRKPKPKRCAKCQEEIEIGTEILAMGKPWHRHCFLCNECGIPLTPTNYYVIDGKPYCENDANKLLTPKEKCCHCGGAIGPERPGFHAMGKPWHRECFNCAACKKPLTPNNFRQLEGLPYCQDDYDRLTKPKEYCCKCRGEITPQRPGLIAMGKPWHRDCFNCTACHIPLSPDNFRTLDGLPYCNDDYDKLTRPKEYCCKCRGEITPQRPGLVAMGKPWHRECFNCTACHIPLTPDNFRVLDGLPYCNDDYDRLTKPKEKCAKCFGDIDPPRRPGIYAMGKPWHPECFNCTACHIPLEPNHFYVLDGLPYCPKDYERLTKPKEKCCKCNGEIGPERPGIHAMGKPWHRECFDCNLCHCPLSPTNYFLVNGKPYCADCAKKLTTPKEKCCQCHQDIPDGGGLRAMGRNWHPECFRCAACNCLLHPPHFVEIGGLPYCEKDAQRILNPPRPEKRAKEQYEFFPGGWANPLDIDIPSMRNRYFIDYFPQISPTGPGIFRSPSLQDLSEKFHVHVHDSAPPLHRSVSTPSPNPLKRHVSYSDLPDGYSSEPEERHTYFRPSSQNRYEKPSGRVCAACSKEIYGRCITAVAANSRHAQRFHPECFVCTYCLKALNVKGTYKENDMKPYCHECFYRLYSGPIMEVGKNSAVI